MVINIFMLLFISIAVMLFSYKRAYAWMGSMSPERLRGSYKDVHFSDTMQWCMLEGMGQGYAYQTAYSCNMVDIIHKLDKGWHLNTNPPVVEDSRNLYYSQEYTRALECVDTAYACNAAFDGTNGKLVMEELESFKREALIHLGYSLHPLQDRISHMNASCGKKDIGIKHGEFGSVAVLKTDGSFYGFKTQGDLFDDLDYDFYGDRESCPLQGQWYYLGQGGKYVNARWIDTENVTRNVVSNFMSYAEAKNISFE